MASNFKPSSADANPCYFLKSNLLFISQNNMDATLSLVFSSRVFLQRNVIKAFQYFSYELNVYMYINISKVSYNLLVDNIALF